MTSFEPFVRLLGDVLATLVPFAAIVADLMSAFSSLVAATLNIVFAALAPLLTMLKVVLDWLRPVFQALALVAGMLNDLSMVVRIFADTLARFFGGLFGKIDLTDTFEAIRKAFQKFLVYLVTFVGALLKWLGWTKMFNSLLGAVTDEGTKKTSAGHAVATDVKFQSFADYGRELAVRSAVAGAGGEKVKKSEDWLKEIADRLAGLDENTLPKMLVAAIIEAWELIKKNVPDTGTFGTGVSVGVTALEMQINRLTGILSVGRSALGF
jgi:hypothetical protein